MIIYDIEMWKGFTRGHTLSQEYGNCKTNTAIFRSREYELIVGLSERYESSISSSKNYPIDLVSVQMSLDCIKNEDYIFKFHFDFTELIGHAEYPSCKYVKSGQETITLFGVELPYPTIEYLSKNTHTSIMELNDDDEMLDFLMNLKLLAQ
jgi:hypothetical protein